MKKILLSFLAVIITILTVKAQTKIPELKQRVTDLTNTLNFQEWQALENQFKAYEDSLNVQISVLIVGSLDNENIEDFTAETFELNRIGQNNNNRGLLLVAEKANNRFRIQFTKPLKDLFTNDLINSIIGKEIEPYFKSNNYFGGLVTGIDAIINQIAKTETQGSKAGISVLVSVILLVVAIIIIVFVVIPYVRKKRKNATTNSEEKK